MDILFILPPVANRTCHSINGGLLIITVPLINITINHVDLFCKIIDDHLIKQNKNLRFFSFFHLHIFSVKILALEALKKIYREIGKPSEELPLVDNLSLCFRLTGRF